MPGMSGLELQQAMEERGIELPSSSSRARRPRHRDPEPQARRGRLSAQARRRREAPRRHLLGRAQGRLRPRRPSAELLKAGAKALSDRGKTSARTHLARPQRRAHRLRARHLRAHRAGPPRQNLPEVRNSFGQGPRGHAARHHAPHRQMRPAPPFFAAARRSLLHARDEIASR